jgi:hypothetical protein
MKGEFGIEEGKAFATGLLHGLEVVADYMKACYPPQGTEYEWDRVRRKQDFAFAALYSFQSQRSA